MEKEHENSIDPLWGDGNDAIKMGHLTELTVVCSPCLGNSTHLSGLLFCVTTVIVVTLPTPMRPYYHEKLYIA